MKKYLVLLVALLMGSLIVSAEKLCRDGGGVSHTIDKVVDANHYSNPSIQFTLYNSNPYEVTVHGWVELKGEKIGCKFSKRLPAATNNSVGKKEIKCESSAITSPNKGDYSLGGPTARGLVYVEVCN